MKIRSIKRPKNNGMNIRMAIVTALLVVASSAALAQEAQETPGGSRDDQAACRADSRRFCRTVDPDSGTSGILMCLKHNRSKLSRACRGVLESHGH